jgi:hypothetical protein
VNIRTGFQSFFHDIHPYATGRFAPSGTKKTMVYPVLRRHPTGKNTASPQNTHFLPDQSCPVAIFPDFPRKNTPLFPQKCYPVTFRFTMAAGGLLFFGKAVDRPCFCAFSLCAKEAAFFRVKLGISGK